MKKNDEVLSLEQMRILLHISKRKASWMLQNQVIPCIVNDQMTTHKYILHPFSKTRGVSERNTHIDASPKSHLSFQKKAPPAHVSSEMPFPLFPAGCGIRTHVT